MLADRPRLTDRVLPLGRAFALGGLFNAVVAPVLFDSLAQYPLAIVLACRALPVLEGLDGARVLPLEEGDEGARLGRAGDRRRGRGVGAGGGADERCRRQRRRPLIVFGLALGIVFNLLRRTSRRDRRDPPPAAPMPEDEVDAPIARGWSFFGIYKVEADGAYHTIHDGTTVHGVERVGPERRYASYYNVASPVGQLFRAMGDDPRPPAQRTAIVGLGAGGAGHHMPGGRALDVLRDRPDSGRHRARPQAVHLLRPAPAATTSSSATAAVARCPPRPVRPDHDRRVHLRRRPRPPADARGAVIYLGRLRPDGVLLFNISNRFVDFEPVLGNWPATCGCARHRHLKVTDARADRRWDSSTWAVMARDPAILERLGWRACHW